MAKKYQSQLKKPISPYYLFRSQVFQSVRLENPDVSIFDLTKIIGSRWEKLPQTEKARFEAEYRKNKQFYEKYMLEHPKEFETKLPRYGSDEERESVDNDASQSDEYEFQGKGKKATGKKMGTSKLKSMKKKQNKAAKTNKSGKSVKETAKKSANKTTYK